MMREKISAKVVAECLEEIRLGHDGKLRPPDVVDAARPEDYPIHPHFEWNDSVAAEEHRLWQARQLIRSVRVEIQEKEVAQYYNVRIEPREDSYYVPAEVIVEQPDQFQKALEQLLEKLEGAKRSLAELEHIAKNTGSHSDRLALIALAAQAFAAAASAVQAIQ